jgi:hypothetical protein
MKTSLLLLLTAPVLAAGATIFIHPTPITAAESKKTPGLASPNAKALLPAPAPLPGAAKAAHETKPSNSEVPYRASEFPLVEERSVPMPQKPPVYAPGWQTPPTGGKNQRVAPRGAMRRNPPVIVRGGPYGGVHAIVDGSWRTSSTAFTQPNGRVIVSCNGNKPCPKTHKHAK